MSKEVKEFQNVRVKEWKVGNCGNCGIGHGLYVRTMARGTHSRKNGEE